MFGTIEVLTLVNNIAEASNDKFVSENLIGVVFGRT